MRRAVGILAAASLALLGVHLLLARTGPTGTPERPLLASFLPESIAGILVGDVRIARAPFGWAVVSETAPPRVAKTEPIDRLIESLRTARILRRAPGEGDSTWTRLILVGGQREEILDLTVGPEAPEGGTLLGIKNERVVVGEQLWALIHPPGGTWDSGPMPPGLASGAR